MAIKAVVFDLGGVLEIVDDDAWPELWVQRAESRLGLAAGTFAAGMAEHEPVGSVVTGEVCEQQMRQMYAAALGLDEEQTDELMAEMWDAYCGVLDGELRDFCASLRADYTTAILSNSADGARREEQQRFGLADLVDSIVYSHEVGLAKPDPAIYRLTCERLAVAPDGIVFLDDKEANVLAACDLGWHAVLHRDTAESIATITAIIETHAG